MFNLDKPVTRLPLSAFAGVVFSAVLFIPLDVMNEIWD